MLYTSNRQGTNCILNHFMPGVLQKHHFNFGNIFLHFYETFFKTNLKKNCSSRENQQLLFEIIIYLRFIFKSTINLDGTYHKKKSRQKTCNLLEQNFHSVGNKKFREKNVHQACHDRTKRSSCIPPINNGVKGHGC